MARMRSTINLHMSGVRHNVNIMLQVSPHKFIRAYHYKKYNIDMFSIEFTN